MLLKGRVVKRQIVFLTVNAFWQEFEIWYMANYFAVHRIKQQNSETSNLQLFANLSTNQIIFNEKSNYDLANQACKTCFVVFFGNSENSSLYNSELVVGSREQDK